MVKIRKDELGFFIKFNPQLIEECISIMKEHKITRLEIETDYELENLNFLKEFPFLKKLSVRNHKLRDLSGINYLPQLKTLAINDVKPNLSLDLTEQVFLEALFGTLPKKTIGLNKLNNLKRLELWSYSPKDKDLTEITNLVNLEEVRIIQGNIMSIEGISGLKKLKRLELAYLRNLTDILPFEKLESNLRYLEIDHCKKVEKYDSISNLYSLETLLLNDCGDIPSINFVKNLTNLKTLVFAGSNIVDGDLSLCENMDYVYFTNKKHYSHRVKDFKNNLVN